MEFTLKVLDPRMASLIPSYATSGSAAVDLCACLEEGVSGIVVPPGKTVMVGTGIAIHLNNPAVAGMILPRSGLGAKHGIILGNGTGLIDSDYQGELKMCIWNRSDKAFGIAHGDRIAQYMVVPVIQGKFNVVEEFAVETTRAVGGFGSTGK